MGEVFGTESSRTTMAMAHRWVVRFEAVVVEVFRRRLYLARTVDLVVGLSLFLHGDGSGDGSQFDPLSDNKSLDLGPFISRTRSTHEDIIVRYHTAIEQQVTALTIREYNPSNTLVHLP